MITINGNHVAVTLSTDELNTLAILVKMGAVALDGKRATAASNGNHGIAETWSVMVAQGMSFVDDVKKAEELELQKFHEVTACF